jgi:PST family polysaccharide transporter
LEITGIAFLIGYIVYFAIVYLLVRWLQGFRWQFLSLKLLTSHVVLAAGLLTIAFVAPVAGLFLSPLAASVTGVFGLRIVLEKVGPEGRMAGKCFHLYAKLGWAIRNNQ